MNSLPDIMAIIENHVPVPGEVSFIMNPQTMLDI